MHLTQPLTSDPAALVKIYGPVPLPAVAHIADLVYCELARRHQGDGDAWPWEPAAFTEAWTNALKTMSAASGHAPETIDAAMKQLWHEQMMADLADAGPYGRIE